MNKHRVLDVCCGSRMFYFEKNNSDVIFCDNRTVNDKLCDNRELVVQPDIIADFRNIPFPDSTFSLVVFDPPHLIHAGKNSWLAKKYGVLNEDWEQDIKQGFNECFRVLQNGGTLVFKWNHE